MSTTHPTTALCGHHDRRFDPPRSVLDTSAESLAKGNRAVVLGRLRTRTWETPEGDKRSVTEIDADEVAPSLRWATARPERPERSRNGERGTERGQFNDEPSF